MSSYYGDIIYGIRIWTSNNGIALQFPEDTTSVEQELSSNIIDSLKKQYLSLSSSDKYFYALYTDMWTTHDRTNKIPMKVWQNVSRHQFEIYLGI